MPHTVPSLLLSLLPGGSSVHAWLGQLCRNAGRLLCCPGLWKLLGMGIAEEDAPCSFPGLLHSSQPRGLKQRWKHSVLGFCAQWAPHSSRIGSSPCPEQLNGIKSKSRSGQNSNAGVCQAGGLAVSLHYLLLLDSDAWSEVLTHICNLPLL